MLDAPGASTNALDAAVVGAGPNGLAAAIVLAEAGLKVKVFERAAEPGGGARSSQLTLPGCLHDSCSAVHPLAFDSPLFRRLPLGRHGLDWIHPPVAMAHPFDDGTAAALYRDVGSTARTLAEDAAAYTDLATRLVETWPSIERDVLGPLRFPRRPFRMAGFGLSGIQSAAGFARRRFRGERGRAFFAGLAAHSCLPLDRAFTSGIALVLAILGHRAGWPFPAGGAGKITRALASHLASLGGEIRTSFNVETIADLPGSRVVLLDLTPRQIVSVAGNQITGGYRRQLEGYRYGMGAFKLDLAIAGPIPFLAEKCREAGVVHLGGTLEEIAEAEGDVWAGRHPRRPFVILSQPTIFDSSRAPHGLHLVWAYCHVPNGSGEDMSEAIEEQIERFAPGFRRLIVARHFMTAADLERHNPNNVGGDINGGVQDWRQFYSRPAIRWSPYSTPAPGLYICSSSTPPGGGVHGMCGYHAARCALRRLGD